MLFCVLDAFFFEGIFFLTNSSCRFTRWQNKNRYVLHLCSILVACKLVKKIAIYFMVAGHTRFLCDAAHGLLRHELEKSGAEIWSPDHFVSVVHAIKANCLREEDMSKQWIGEVVNISPTDKDAPTHLSATNVKLDANAKLWMMRGWRHFLDSEDCKTIFGKFESVPNIKAKHVFIITRHQRQITRHMSGNFPAPYRQQFATQGNRQLFCSLVTTTTTKFAALSRTFVVTAQRTSVQINCRMTRSP